MIKNIFLTYNLSSSIAPELLQGHRVKWVSCNEGDFWTTPKGGGWLSEGPVMWLEGWNIQSHPSNLWGRKRGWRLNQPMSNDLVSHDCSKASIKTQEDSFFGSFQRASMPPSWAPSEDRSPLVWDLGLCISSSRCCFVFFIISFSKLVNLRKWFPEFCELHYQIYQS